MRIDRRVSSGTSQVLVLAVGDVEMRFGIAVLLGETEIDDVDLVTTLANSHEKVVWLDVAMDEVARVDVLDTRDLHRSALVNDS